MSGVVSIHKIRAAAARSLYQQIPTITKLDMHSPEARTLYRALHDMTQEERDQAFEDIGDTMLAEHYRLWVSWQK